MPRRLLPESQVHPAIRADFSAHHADIVAAAESAIASHPVVVFGMAGNPFVRKARRLLDAAGIGHHDIDHGGYLSEWRKRNALKMWSGWPTFPMVFVRGVLVGGAGDLQKLQASGELKRLLAQEHAPA